MRALVATVLFLLLNLQLLAGAALCLRHHAVLEGAACEAAMQMDTPDSGRMGDHQDVMSSSEESPPMAAECAAAMACAAPAPIVTGAPATLAFNPHLLRSEAWPAAAHRADAPAAQFFRPPIA